MAKKYDKLLCQIMGKYVADLSQVWKIGEKNNPEGLLCNFIILP